MQSTKGAAADENILYAQALRMLHDVSKKKSAAPPVGSISQSPKKADRQGGIWN